MEESKQFIQVSVSKPRGPEGDRQLRSGSDNGLEAPQRIDPFEKMVFVSE
jgi:hypothetical protein